MPRDTEIKEELFPRKSDASNPQLLPGKERSNFSRFVPQPLAVMATPTWE